MGPEPSEEQFTEWRVRLLQVEGAKKPNPPAHLCHTILSHTLLWYPAPPPRDLRKTGQGSARTPSQVLTHWKASWEGKEARSRRAGGYLRAQVEAGRKADLYKGCLRNPDSSPKSLYSTWEACCQVPYLPLPHVGLWEECSFTPGLSTPLTEVRKSWGRKGCVHT